MCYNIPSPCSLQRNTEEEGVWRMNQSELIRFADEIYNDIGALRRAFTEPQRGFGPYLYLPVVNSGENATLENAERLVASCKRDGYAGLIPYYPSEENSRPFEERYLDTMKAVYDACAAYGLKSAYFDDHLVMESFFEQNPDAAKEMDCFILNDYEHECVSGETFVRSLSDTEKIMSIVAVEADTAEILDLRSFITETGEIRWKVPEGNWILHRYVCERDSDARLINMLNYDVCIRYFTRTCRVLCDALDEEARASMRVLICRNVQYGGKNRRMWSPEFNEIFRARFGFDPAPYYPCLFQDAGISSQHYRALMMSCRASMLSEGYMKAAADFAAARGMLATGFAIESKATACSWLFGDGQMLHRYLPMPGISMPFAYLYGLNGIKVAAGASDSFERGLLSADMFRRYEDLGEDILYRETMNAFVRGVNFLMTHFGEEEEKTLPQETGARQIISGLFAHNRAAEDYTDFCARTSMMLRGGRHVCETAVLYPIHSIHARTYLYEFALSGFEYPAVLENADYMTVMNNLLTYGCMDAEFLHPDVLCENCYSEDGYLYRSTGTAGGRYSMVILPGTDMISVRAMRMLAKFYDDGGRILATGCLPVHAFELEETISCLGMEKTRYDAEVQQLAAHIFGADAVDPSVFREVYSNTNENGGTACFIPAITTAVDGTDMVPAADMMGILRSFAAPADVLFVHPPKIEYSGVVAYDLPTFRHIGVDVKLARSGSLGYLHRRNNLCDMYYITNTTDKVYENDVLLHGRLNVEEWNPYKGKAHRVPFEHVRVGEEVYTLVRLSLPAASSTFLVCPTTPAGRDGIRPSGVTGELREYRLPRN